MCLVPRRETVAAALEAFVAEVEAARTEARTEAQQRRRQEFRESTTTMGGGLDHASHEEEATIIGDFHDPNSEQKNDGEGFEATGKEGGIDIETADDHTSLPFVFVARCRQCNVELEVVMLLGQFLEFLEITKIVFVARAVPETHFAARFP